MGLNKIRKALRSVLSFSSELIVCKIKNEKPKEERIIEVRKHCKFLKDEGIYDFNVEVEDAALFKQVLEFASHVNG